MTARDEAARVVDLRVERARRRGEGWPALEAELEEVPDVCVLEQAGEPPAGWPLRSASDRRVENVPVDDGEQLSLFDRERRRDGEG